MDRIGRYKIIRELGRGAMGVVYHAIDPNIGRPVAIKTIQFGGGQKSDEQERMRERLFREARSAGMMSHPGIVTIYDVEQQGDLAYIAMEFVDGPTLDQVLSEPHGVSAELMFSILGQTAVALDYAHQKGIVHRDIKPANIMIAAGGTVKITDFGIAKITASEQLTMTGSIVGTPHYMSPEQVQGQAVDGRSDQFSLAVIAFEMLTGEKPYTGEHLTTVVYKIVAEEPAPLMRLNPSLGTGIDGVIRKALSKRLEDRYLTCQGFVDALERACDATKGWKPLPRGGSLSEPTLADVGRPLVSLPPAARRRSDMTQSGERVGQRKTGFLTFLLAILVATGLLALIGWQAAPWLLPNLASNGKQAETAKPKSKSSPRPAASNAGGAANVASPNTATGAASASGTPAGTKAEAKPSPLPPVASFETPKPAPAVEKAVKKAAPDETPVKAPAPKRPPVRVAATQPVTVISSPGGATATMDGRTDLACTTPCSIDATPGRHSVAIALRGYQMETREVDVGNAPLEMSAVVLHAPGGTLMLTTVPPGASVLVDGKRIPQSTPAQIQLPPGSYKITVERDGKQASQTVEIRGGISYLRIPLEQ